MKLYLVRHATAVEGIGGAIQNDAQRPLTEEGRREAKTVAGAVKALRVQPSAFISSPLVRARQTATIFQGVLAGDVEVHITDTLAPGGSAHELFKYLRQWQNDKEIFLFGHEPSIGRLAGQLIAGSVETPDIPFKKAAVCRIDIYDLASAPMGTLKWFITPKIAALMSK